MVAVDSHGISRVPRYSGACREPACCRLRGCHPLWPIVPDRSTNVLVGNSLALNQTGPTTPSCKHDGLGSSAFARRYWRNHYCFLFLQVLRWFTSLRCLHIAYVFSDGSFGISQRGFPHSEIPGSKLICSSPGLIAAYRVLHRLLEPRHSPYTLSSLTIRNSNLRSPGSGESGLGIRKPIPTPKALIPNLRKLHAHCVCVVGKTTVCRVFSCQRTSLRIGPIYQLLDRTV